MNNFGFVRYNIGHNYYNLYNAFGYLSNVFGSYYSYIKNLRNVSKLDIVLLVTWLWAYFSYQVAKFMECVFILMMKLPEFLIPQYITSIRTSQNVEIKIKDAKFNGVSKLRKFEWFLNFYFERVTDDCPFDENGIDLFKLKKIVDFTTLCINYYKVNDEPPYTERQLIAHLSEDINFYDENNNLILFGRAAFA